MFWIAAGGRDSYIRFIEFWLKFHEFDSYYTFGYIYYGFFMHLSLGAGGGVVLSIFRSEFMVAWVSIETIDEPEIIALTGLERSSVLMLSQLCDWSCFSCWLILVARLSCERFYSSCFDPLLSVFTL